MLYSAVLEGNGFAVELVGDGAHALAKAREFCPDVIIMDIQLPNVSGLELIEALQRDPEFRRVPILAVTAFVGKGEERRIRQAGAKAFMAKPISIRPLVATINGLLGET